MSKKPHVATAEYIRTKWLDITQRLMVGGTQITVTADEVNNLVSAQTPGLRIVAGQHETVTASDEIETGLSTVVAVVATLDDDPAIDAFLVTASIGDQDGDPDAGSVVINTWQPTDVDDATPIAATGFGVKVNWVAVGL